MRGELEPGDALGPYRLESVAGEGALGIVFRAIRREDGRTVALKVLRRELSGNELFRRRFEHEARAAMALEHRHLVPVLDAGEEAGRCYVVAAYVDGCSLATRIAESGALALAGVLRLAAEVGGGLDALHRAGLVHRDVKPGNILLAHDGAAALTDFGLAKGPAYTALTRPGQVLGTPHYLAPELIEGTEATPASDVYALGCVVFECVAGVPPFSHRRLFEVAFAHLEEAPPDPCAGRSDLPAELGAAVLEALAKEPARRPGTATAYSHLLRFAASADGAGRC
jgi:serine/threonine protein kinase